MVSAKRRKPPARAIRNSHLSKERRWLVETMQRLWYGRVKHLTVFNHEPRPLPSPKICPCHKLVGSPDRPREVPQGDYLLKEPAVKLCDELDAMGDCVISIDVHEGLPAAVMYE
ncbi:MAG: hypothetical protein NTX87_18900 [Planctomycetota bacterium]|nr:hypothetical protein [Planctomycetota bacterium]